MKKPIPRYPSYMVSSSGAVHGQRGRPLKPGLSGSGYLFVFLCNADGKKMHQVHRLVASLFCEGSGRDVNHKNGIKTDNRSKNLEWCSRSENQRHAADIGLKPSGERSHLCTKLVRNDVLKIRKLCASGMSQQKVANIFGISQTYVGRIHRRIKWRQV